MKICIEETKDKMGARAAADGAAFIRDALAAKTVANIVVATGASQFEMLSSLVAEPDIAWDRVQCFHLDEYAGMSIEHPASFRKYLKERFVDLLPTAPLAFHYINGEDDLAAECQRLGTAISQVEIDAAFIGIGENAHLAFNDPPADFETTEPYLVVNLDEACRKQQQGEGWFPTLADVPTQAISMSIQQILKSRAIICTVPDERKSQAVQAAVEGEKTPAVPASILREHARATLYLDRPAASRLSTS